MLENLFEDGAGITSNEDRNIKIVRFKDLVSDTDSNMAVDSPQAPVASWKYKLLGRGSSVSVCEEELEFLEGDIMRTTANGVPAINFSERIQQILIRDMATTVVVKLLGSKEKPVELLKPFGPWVLIERKSRRNPRTNRSLNAKISAKEGVGSRFSALMSLGEDTTVIDAVAMGLSGVQDTTLVDPTPVNKSIEYHVNGANSEASLIPVGEDALTLVLDEREVVGHSVVNAHLNPIFEGLTESMIKVNSSVLNP
ncbi:hypothetical protein Goarm_000582 [Gossypium armourianum]|uniref:Uncharacterized protein n=1 Tax=Gossypium armourianum TaxID=34283 RepID=A0A7J9KAK2_9ROSI|nr:hypothetical protein [Gossypium armourianum]